MILSPEKNKEFEAVTKPVIKWLNDNCHPHTHITIDTMRAELAEGVCAFDTEEYIKD